MLVAAPGPWRTFRLLSVANPVLPTARACSVAQLTPKISSMYSALSFTRSMYLRAARRSAAGWSLPAGDSCRRSQQRHPSGAGSSLHRMLLRTRDHAPLIAACPLPEHCPATCTAPTPNSIQLPVVACLAPSPMVLGEDKAHARGHDKIREPQIIRLGLQPPLEHEMCHDSIHVLIHLRMPARQHHAIADCLLA
jgi:hypothetical protein